MLKRLFIQNFGLIQQAEVSFEKGLTTVTGETGAGKSFVLKSLDLALGGRAQNLPKNDQKIILEAEFIDSEESLIFRRIIEGKGSRLFLNDEPTTAESISSLREKLLDIHAQHENLWLKRSETPALILDKLLPDMSIRDDFQQNFEAMKQCEKVFLTLKEEALQIENEKDFWRFQYADFEGLDTDPNFLESQISALEAYKKRAEQADAWHELEDKIQGESSVLSHLDDAMALIDRKGLEIDTEKLNNIFIQLQGIVKSFPGREDLGSDLALGLEDLEKIKKLQKKYNAPDFQILEAKKQDLAQKIKRADQIDNDLEEARHNLEQSQNITNQSAQILTEARRAVVPEFCKQMMDLCSELGMPQAQFEVCFTPQEVGRWGDQKLEFLFSAQKNMPPKNLSQVASGGEISRLMLAIKSFDLGDGRTLIFDEIDTGISGAIAEKMATLMKKLSETNQTIVISHLPQIAAAGSHQIQISKSHDESGATTDLRVLSFQEREHSLAQMLSGEEVTDSAIENARRLLKF